jgi:VanZ family protein
MSLLRLLPPIAWTAVIAHFSGPGWGGASTSLLLIPLLGALLPWAGPEQLQAAHWLVRKAAHVTEYAVLAGLWRWALAPRIAWPGLAAFGCAVLTAALDELHQATTLTRTGSAADVLLDALGAAAALAALVGGWATIEVVINALLWIAAAGGTALIAINWMAEIGSGWLWLSAPAAWIALGVRQRMRGRCATKP